MRGVLAGNEKNAQLANEGFQPGFAASVLHIPNRLRDFTWTAPDTDVNWPWIRLVRSGNDCIRSLAVLALPNNLSVRLLGAAPFDADAVVVSLPLESNRTQRVRSGILRIMFSQVLIHLVVFIEHGQNVLLLCDHAVGAGRRDQSL